MSTANMSADSIKMSAAAKTSKKSAKTETAAPAVAAPAAATPAPKAKKVKEEKVVAPVAAAPTPVAAPAPEAAVAAEEDVGAALQKAITELHEQLSSLKAAASTAAAALKSIEKQAARVVKKAERKRKRTSNKATSSADCVFTRPVKITDELCSFLGKPKGTEISRSAVTKGVMAYARSHNLMDKQTIKADAALRKLLTLTEADTLTILNLQKYLSRHYVKDAPKSA
jgi:chromatin remodeling complex protein RSC6